MWYWLCFVGKPKKRKKWRLWAFLCFTATISQLQQHHSSFSSACLQVTSALNSYWSTSPTRRGICRTRWEKAKKNSDTLVFLSGRCEADASVVVHYHSLHEIKPSVVTPDAHFCSRRPQLFTLLLIFLLKCYRFEPMSWLQLSSPNMWIKRVQYAQTVDIYCSECKHLKVVH